jgi:DNA polymerase phi
LALDLLHDITEKNGTSSGQEEREFYFARLFGYQSFGLSGMLSRPSTTLDDISLICENIIKYSNKKNYLQTACCAVLLVVLEAAQAHEYKDEMTRTILEKYLKVNHDSPDAVWFVLEAKKLTNYHQWSALLPDWKNGEILSKKNKGKLINSLISSTYHDTALHPVFKALIFALVKECDPKNLQLFEFWDEIGEAFFNSSHDRKFMGFQIFQEILPSITSEQVPLIFTPHFMRCLINSLSSKETYLNKKARQTVRN